MLSNPTKTTADNLYHELTLLGRSKRMKVRTLMKYFNYEKRTENSATHITELLLERNIILNPSIMKIGDEWRSKLDDQIYLTINPQSDFAVPFHDNLVPENWNHDEWFDEIKRREYRTEKEVESKFLVPLLTRLGYKEFDRYDGMPVFASLGSKPIRLEVDYALFNTERFTLNNQVLLIAEGKLFKDNKSRQAQRENARNQVKSYAYWVSCHFGLITDGKEIEVIKSYPIIGGKKIVFECSQEELKSAFADLYKIISKSSLTLYYETLLKIQE